MLDLLGLERQRLQKNIKMLLILKAVLTRGNNSEYIERVIGNYDLRYKQYTSSKHKKIELQEGETLEDALLRLGYKLIKK